MRSTFASGDCHLATSWQVWQVLEPRVEDLAAIADRSNEEPQNGLPHLSRLVGLVA